MNDCTPGEGILFESNGGEMKLKVFQDCGFAGFALPNSEQ